MIPEAAELTEIIAAEFAADGETVGETISRFQHAEAAARRIELENTKSDERRHMFRAFHEKRDAK